MTGGHRGSGERKSRSGGTLDALITHESVGRLQHVARSDKMRPIVTDVPRLCACFCASVGNKR